MEIRNNLLFADNGTQVPYIHSPNRGRTYVPRYIIMHYTDSTSASSTIEWFQDPSSRVSAHLLIGRDGTITQFVPFNYIAWHAGESTWNGLLSLNQYSIGIELVNGGRLARSGTNWICGLTGQIIPPGQILMAQHKNETFISAWQTYSATQLSVATTVGKTLAGYYAIEDILGHDDVAPGRKADPGPAFPMDTFRTAILGH